MPELPDVELYLHSLERYLGDRTLQQAIVRSPFVLRTFDPPIETVRGCQVESFSRIGKRIVWHLQDDLHLVFHLMIAGRFHWRKPNRRPTGKNELAAFQFEHGTIMLTEASQKKRASLHLVRGGDALRQFDRGGLEVLQASPADFKERLLIENRTVKRVLTDPRRFSGIGNAYSDEILLEAAISPLQRTRQLTPDQIERLYRATRMTLTTWIQRLREQAADRFPEKVRAIRPEMLAHGKFGEPCPRCTAPIQRIRYADRECNYCPGCQTQGRILADRSLSRLLKDEWPRTLDELEADS